MIIDEMDSKFHEIMKQFEDWFCDPENRLIKEYYVGLLKQLAELPVYGLNGVLADTHALDGCTTVKDLLEIYIAKGCDFLIDDYDYLTIDLYWKNKMHTYAVSNIYASWLIQHKSEVLSVVGDQWSSYFDQPEILWQLFLSDGEIDFDIARAGVHTEPIEQWTIDQLMAAEGVSPISEAQLRANLTY